MVAIRNKWQSLSNIFLTLSDDLAQLTVESVPHLVTPHHGEVTVNTKDADLIPSLFRDRSEIRQISLSIQLVGGANQVTLPDGRALPSLLLSILESFPNVETVVAGGYGYTSDLLSVLGTASVVRKQALQQKCPHLEHIKITDIKSPIELRRGYNW